jgi:hypothetical protein
MLELQSKKSAYTSFKTLNQEGKSVGIDEDLPERLVFSIRMF